MQILINEKILLDVANKILTCAVISAVGFLLLFIAYTVMRLFPIGSAPNRENHRLVFQIVVASLPVGTALTLAGYMLGNARETVVGDIIPAFVALASGLLAYFFTKLGNAAIIISLLILIATMEIFVAATIGAAHRGIYEEKARYNLIQEEVARRRLLQNLEID